MDFNSNVNHGMAQTGVRELTPWMYWDWLHFNDGDALVDDQFFRQGVSKNQIFQNLSFPASLTVKLTIIGLKVQSNILFAKTGVTAAALAYRYENHSYISFKKENKIYTDYMIGDLQSHCYYQAGGTFAVREKWDDYYRLPQPIEVPSAGRLEVEFKPATNLTTGTGVADVSGSYKTIGTDPLGHEIGLCLVVGLEQGVN